MLAKPTVAIALLIASALFARPAAGASFLVAELPASAVHGDSYVIELEDPMAIAHARALIAEGAAAGEPIVFARVAAGADGENRDWLAPGHPAWSWHVAELLGFGDLGAELYDGWPGLVESDVAGWIANTEGVIGFWSYTVVAELPEVPEPAASAGVVLGLVALGAARRATSRARAGFVQMRVAPSRWTGCNDGHAHCSSSVRELPHRARSA